MADLTLPRISVVIATTARPSLARTLRSITDQDGLLTTDQIVVVGTEDFFDVATPPPSERVKLKIRIMDQPGGDWGNYERAIGTEVADGDYIMYCDDDDALLPGAISAVRRAIRRHPGQPHMFRMIDPNGLPLWQTPEIKVGNVGTPMFVFPNIPAQMGRWTPGKYEGDFDFMQSTLALYPPNSLVWDSTIICGCRTFGGD